MANAIQVSNPTHISIDISTAFLSVLHLKAELENEFNNAVQIASLNGLTPAKTNEITQLRKLTGRAVESVVSIYSMQFESDLKDKVLTGIDQLSREGNLNFYSETCAQALNEASSRARLSKNLNDEEKGFFISALENVAMYHNHLVSMVADTVRL